MYAHLDPKCAKERSLPFKEKLLPKVQVVALDDVHVLQGRDQVCICGKDQSLGE